MYAVAPNALGMDSLSFQCGADPCTLTMTSDSGRYTFAFGNGAWRDGETTRRGPYLVAARSAYVGLPPLRVAAAYAWDDARTLRLVLRYIESPHTETWTARFDGDRVAVTVISSLRPPPAAPALHGTLARPGAARATGP
jgi:hypothetical protein